MKINYFSRTDLIIHKHGEECVSVFLESTYIYCSQTITILGLEMNKTRTTVAVLIVFVGKITISINDNFSLNYV